MRPIYIYGLYDPRDGALRYIGATQDAARRLVWHLCPSSLARKSAKSEWLRGLIRMNLKPSVRIIEEASALTWRERERHYIARFRASGAQLTNTTPGGEGGATCTGKRWTEERRRHISEKFKGHGISERTRAALRQPRPSHRRIEFDDNQLRELYTEQFLTTRQIAEILGVTSKPVTRRLRELGLVRSASESCRIRNLKRYGHIAMAAQRRAS